VDSPHAVRTPTSDRAEARALLPITEWLFACRREWLQPELIAGATTAAVVIPNAMAYATVAGLPVEVGLYTVFAPMLVYALFGTSRVLSVSTTTTIAILVGTQLAQVVPGGDRDALLTAGATLTLLVGGVLVAASVLRLGFVANFISAPVLVGFKAGIGLVIVLNQIPKLLGVHFAKGTFLQKPDPDRRSAAGDVAPGARRRARDPGNPHCVRARRAARTGAARRHRGGHRRGRPVRSPGGDRRRGAARSASSRATRLVARGGALARRARHCADELH
jgi:hypothetical protein